MSTLYLFRHAKSDWSDRTLDDHDRPLAPRGERAAPAMASYMEAEGLDPRVVLCSTAARTRRTWDLLARRIGDRAAVIYENELYGASRSAILRIVGRVSDGTGPLMVIGHNPGLQDTALALAGAGPDRERGHLERKLPTAALVVLEAEIDAWSDLGQGACRLERFVRPKDLPGAEEQGL